jgi:hypothetical protein
LGYQHLGTFLYFNDSGALSDDIGWWQRFLEGWHGAVETILDWGQAGIEDHRMMHYRRRIEGALQGRANLRLAPDGRPPQLQQAEPAATRIKPRRRAA